MEGQITGTVKFFNATKGFGFITRDDGQPDVFFHVSKIRDQGTEFQGDEKVAFTLVNGKGVEADQVELA